MSLSSSNLATALLTVPRTVSAAELERLRAEWRLRHSGPGRGSRAIVLDADRSLETLLREGQNRFKAPHLRDYGYRLPVPFRWGPNGSLILLLEMLAAYALLAVVVMWGVPLF